MHTYYWHRWLTHLHRANSYVIPSLDVRIQLETPRGQYSTCRQAISVLSLRRSSYPKSDQIDCIYSMCLWLRVLHTQTNSNILLLLTYLSRKYLTRASNKRFYKKYGVYSLQYIRNSTASLYFVHNAVIPVFGYCVKRSILLVFLHRQRFMQNIVFHLYFGQNWPTLQRDISAITELLSLPSCVLVHPAVSSIFVNYGSKKVLPRHIHCILN